MAAYILRIAEGQTPILAALHSLLTLSSIFFFPPIFTGNGLNQLNVHKVCTL